MYQSGGVKYILLEELQELEKELMLVPAADCPVPFETANGNGFCQGFGF